MPPLNVYISETLNQDWYTAYIAGMHKAAGAGGRGIGMRDIDDFIKEYHSFIKVKSLYYGRDAFEADELRQKTVIMIWQNFHRLMEMSQSAVKSFISVSVKNAMIDMRRQEKHLAELQEHMHRDSHWETQATDGIDLLHVMNRLTPQEQDIIFKTYFIGLDSKEIGKQLNIPAATVRSKLMRARTRLKEVLNRNG